MDLDEFYEEEQTTDIQVIENQLIIAKQMQNKLIELETQKKTIEDTEKEMKRKLEEVMRANHITGFESTDKRIKISLGEDTTTETIDKDKLWLEHPDIYKECVKETSRKGTLRITIREAKDGVE
jgi:predicted phage-related endonuclease